MLGARLRQGIRVGKDGWPGIRDFDERPGVLGGLMQTRVGCTDGRGSRPGEHSGWAAYAVASTVARAATRWSTRP
jgi:hypothetical protein